TVQGVMVTQRNSFDLQGQAILPRLQRGKEVDFDIGDEALFYFEDDIVKGLIADNTVTVEKYVFIRPLADFEFVIGHTFQRIQAN
ncbi:hypothetical protein H8J56_27385, partial [Klebsiella sp. Kps]|uniref:hypothetical protein n=1 Tax=Klebsiella sp. Kps TaxID=2758579 RepID=UPI001644011A